MVSLMIGIGYISDLRTVESLSQPTGFAVFTVLVLLIGVFLLILVPVNSVLRRQVQELRQSESKMRQGSRIAKIGHFEWDDNLDLAIYISRMGS